MITLNERINKLLTEKFSSNILTRITNNTKNKYGSGIKEYLDVINNKLFVGIKWSEIDDSDIKISNISEIRQGFMNILYSKDKIEVFNNDLVKTVENVFSSQEFYDDFEPLIEKYENILIKHRLKSTLVRQFFTNPVYLILSGDYDDVNSLEDFKQQINNTQKIFLDGLGNKQNSEKFCNDYYEIFNEAKLLLNKYKKLNVTAKLDNSKIKIETVSSSKPSEVNVHFFLDSDEAIIGAIFGDIHRVNIKDTVSEGNIRYVMTINNTLDYMTSDMIKNSMEKSKDLNYLFNRVCKDIYNINNDNTLSDYDNYKRGFYYVDSFYKTNLFKMLNASMFKIIKHISEGMKLSASNVNFNHQKHISVSENIKKVLTNYTKYLEQFREITSNINETQRVFIATVKSLNDVGNRERPDNLYNRIAENDKKIKTLKEEQISTLSRIESLLKDIYNIQNELADYGMLRSDYEDTRKKIESKFAKLTKTENKIKSRQGK